MVRRVVMGGAALAIVGAFGWLVAGLDDASAPPPAATVALAEAPARVEPAAAPVAPAPKPDAYAIRGTLTLDAPLSHGAWAWNDEGVPDGPVLVTADTEAQTLSVFRAGYEIGVAVILYGADDKPTPLGTFPISQKKARHISTIYDAPMPYMLRLTGDGVAIHGSDVRYGGATHGCIGVPTEFARLLFEQVKLGDPVIVTRGKRIPLPAAV